MNEEAIEILGTIGGTMIALSLLPQVIHTFRTKSAGDISYVYQGIYIIGITFVNLYAITFELWPVYIPCIMEETFIVTLTIQKLLYDHNDRVEKRKEERNRVAFSTALSKSTRCINFKTSLTAEQLMEEFNKIDSSRHADGTISKEELKAFLDSGKVGDMKDEE